MILNEKQKCGLNK